MLIENLIIICMYGAPILAILAIATYLAELNDWDQIVSKAKYHIRATCRDKSGNVLSTACNSYNKSHPMMHYLAVKVGHPAKIYLHAEVLALLKTRGKKVHSIHVERYNKRGEPMLAKPCPVCEEAIKAWGVKEVSYTMGIQAT